MAIQANVWSRNKQPMGQTAALNARLAGGGLQSLIANKNRAEDLRRQEEQSDIQQAQFNRQHKLAKKAQKFQKKQAMYDMAGRGLKAGVGMMGSKIADFNMGGWSPGSAAGAAMIGGGLGTLAGGKTGGMIGAGLGAASGGFASAIGSGVKKLLGGGGK
jgi:hypothetical protein